MTFYQQTEYTPSLVKSILIANNLKYQKTVGTSEIYKGIFNNRKRNVILQTDIDFYSKRGLKSIRTQAGKSKSEFSKFLKSSQKPRIKHTSGRDHKKQKKKKKGYKSGKGSQKNLSS